MPPLPGLSSGPPGVRRAPRSRAADRDPRARTGRCVTRSVVVAGLGSGDRFGGSVLWRCCADCYGRGCDRYDTHRGSSDQLPQNMKHMIVYRAMPGGLLLPVLSWMPQRNPLRLRVRSVHNAAMPGDRTCEGQESLCDVFRLLFRIRRFLHACAATYTMHTLTTGVHMRLEYYAHRRTLELQYGVS